ncbi:hypothetical protein J8273_0764 [Carpediemonas membranifera]|uniref:Nucleolus and neural progenitor protein-like N-terminal domain-containing protein n=1 Tax=Carpediemonas membranifera TaxID=201153 RepID=A0A8J6BC00_9EUKA|nr:hypothetical protein J8273_0764 [Carpediemonas membranifera]|eukprot:KAG9397634.1 hypothetical protein J8273_0764 [Carpediemonas membranifera]
MQISAKKPAVTTVGSSDAKLCDRAQKLNTGRHNVLPTKLDNEIQLVNQLYYMFKNAHRKTGYFRKLVTTRRLLNKYKRIDIGNDLKEYAGAFSATIPRLRASPEYSKYLIQRLDAVYALLGEIRSSALIAYAHHAENVARANFVPYSATAMAVMARIVTTSAAAQEAVVKNKGLVLELDSR